jgi:hypothetical protein
VEELYLAPVSYFAFSRWDIKLSTRRQAFALFPILSYIHSYEFNICINSSVQKNCMILYAVEILAA